MTTPTLTAAHRLGQVGHFQRAIVRLEGRPGLYLQDELPATASQLIQGLGAAIRPLSQVKHPSLARLVWAGRSTNGDAHLLTELPLAEPLGFLCSRMRLAGFPPLPLAVAAAVVAQASEAVGALHAQGGFHGRVDGQTVRVSKAGQVYVTDAAFSRAQATADAGLFGEVGPAADVKALAALFELLIGGGVVAGPVFSGPFQDVVGQALAVDPDSRPQDGLVFAAALRERLLTAKLVEQADAASLGRWVVSQTPDRVARWEEASADEQGGPSQVAELLSSAPPPPPGLMPPDFGGTKGIRPPTAYRMEGTTEGLELDLDRASERAKRVLQAAEQGFDPITGRPLSDDPDLKMPSGPAQLGASATNREDAEQLAWQTRARLGPRRPGDFSDEDIIASLTPAEPKAAEPKAVPSESKAITQAKAPAQWLSYAIIGGGLLAGLGLALGLLAYWGKTPPSPPPPALPPAQVSADPAPYQAVGERLVVGAFGLPSMPPDGAVGKVAVALSFPIGWPWPALVARALVRAPGR